MAAPPPAAALEEEDANWAVECALALPEVWGLVAEHTPNLVGLHRLMGVCRASRVGVRWKLRTLPGLVVCGGRSSGAGQVRDVRRLDLATMRWEPMPALVTARDGHACCAVRGSLVVLGGRTSDYTPTSTVELLSSGQAAFVELPALSCGAIRNAVAIPVEESGNALGQVLLLEGWMQGSGPVSTVRLVDLATGVCTPAQVPGLLRRHDGFAAERLPDGRIVCVGGFGAPSSGEVYGPPESGAPDAAWTWRQLPAMSVGRDGCGGCVMSDGGFAVLGGGNLDGDGTSSCEALVTSDGTEHWAPLSSMHDSRDFFACEAIAGCIIVAGGRGRRSAEVYDEVLGRWLRLPRDLPGGDELYLVGGAIM
jgi:hypothetical protein